MLQTPPLIGRERDLAVGLEQLKRIEKGGSASVLIRGEAGIGKTRLATELAGRAEQLGHRVLVGRADEFDRGIPYAPFRDMLARLELPARGAKGLEQRVNEFREGLDAELSLVFSRAVELFRGLTAGAPALLHVDDVHLADADSLALLALLARLGELPLLTVTTARVPFGGRVRDLERLVERMASEGRGAVIDLMPLDRADVKTLVGAAIGAVPEERVVDAALSDSGGNPFFACESVRALDHAGALVVEEGRARLVTDAAAPAPGTALLARVFGSDEEATELAKVVSAFGRISLRHLPLAARLTGRDESVAEETFDRLAREHILVRDPAGAFEFAHGIVRDAVYEEIGPAERRRLHAAIAEELAKEMRAGAVLDIAELATHVAESADPGDERAVDILLEAAETVGATAPLVAAEHYGRAVDLMPAGSPRRYQAMARRARALHIGGRPLDAGAAGREALKGLEQGSQRAATVATVINGLNIAGRNSQGLDVVEAELANGGYPCPLLAQRAHLLLSVGRPADAAEQVPDALAAIDSAPVPAQLIGVQHLLIYASDVGDQRLVNEMTARLERWGEEGPDARRILAHETIALLDRRPGVVASLEYHLAEAAALSPDVGLPSFGGHRETAQAHVHYLRGEWDEALAICRAMAFELDQVGVALVGPAVPHARVRDPDLARGARRRRPAGRRAVEPDRGAHHAGGGVPGAHRACARRARAGARGARAAGRALSGAVYHHAQARAARGAGGALPRAGSRLRRARDCRARHGRGAGASSLRGGGHGRLPARPRERGTGPRAGVPRACGARADRARARSRAAAARRARRGPAAAPHRRLPCLRRPRGVAVAPARRHGAAHARPPGAAPRQAQRRRAHGCRGTTRASGARRPHQPPDRDSAQLQPKDRGGLPVAYLCEDGVRLARGAGASARLRRRRAARGVSDEFRPVGGSTLQMAMTAQLLEAARDGSEDAFGRLIDDHRAELHAHCYRMLGSLHDAEDALQETLLRAWRGLPGFAGRSSLRTWLYTIATNVCLKAIEQRPKRVLPIDYGPASEPGLDLPEPLVESVWIEPYPDDALGLSNGAGAPDARYEQLEAVELAFIAVLQHLPPNQRAVLIERDVLGFSAREVADSLDTSVASVNSALQRARKTVSERMPERSQQETLRTMGEAGIREVVDRYVDAWARGDIAALRRLLADDAVFSMPPWAAWWHGGSTIAGFAERAVEMCPDTRSLPTHANGQPALAGYNLDPESGRYLAAAIDVLTIEAGRVKAITAFIRPDLFERFGMPAELPS